jgi:hypothetical protein
MWNLRGVIEKLEFGNWKLEIEKLEIEKLEIGIFSRVNG